MTQSIGNYQSELTTAFQSPEVIAQLSNISALVNNPLTQRLSNGPDYVVKTQLLVDTKPIDITIKVFKRQNWLKDRYDWRLGSKASRSYDAACFLQSNGINTPAPIAWLERWEGKRLLESYYVCLFEAGISFRDALSDIYYNQHNNEPLMDLLHVVAPAIRAMHDAGFMHGDMGNQNILLPRDENSAWLKPQLIDLNRAKYSNKPLTLEQRAFDLARIALPGAYLKIFKTIYNNHQDFPLNLTSWNKKRGIDFGVTAAAGNGGTRFAIGKVKNYPRANPFIHPYKTFGYGMKNRPSP